MISIVMAYYNRRNLFIYFDNAETLTHCSKKIREL